MTLGQLRTRVAFWQRKLGLQHWTLRVEIVDGFDDSPDSDARCSAADQYDVANLDFKGAFLDAAEFEEVETTIIHELLHVMMRDFDQAIERVDDQLAKAAADLWHAQVLHEREGVVDRLSKVIFLLHSE